MSVHCVNFYFCHFFVWVLLYKTYLISVQSLTDSHPQGILQILIVMTTKRKKRESDLWLYSKLFEIHIYTSVCANLVRSTFWASAQTDSLGTASWGLSFPPSLSLLSWEQSVEELHFFLSSAANCCCWLDFFPDRPQPEVKLPRREKARITIGLEGTDFGLKTYRKPHNVYKICTYLLFVWNIVDRCTNIMLWGKKV